ncbi:MAG: Crp/Fnr family transcriptional regulator [Variovorax sp.]|nr:Crp/Fnr family transcriptional regulator [Variovorax sp.]
MSSARHKAAKDAVPKLLNPAQRLVALESSAWFAGLPIELKTWLAENTTPLLFSAGQRLFGPGDAPDGICFVVEGAVRVATTTSDGREALLAFAEPPQWFGELALFDGAARSHEGWAQSDCVLLRVPQRSLVEFLDQHPVHWKAFGQLVAQKLRLAFRAIEDATLLAPPVRLAHRILAIAHGYSDWNGPSRRVINVQQDHLGSMLGLSRQTVNQILKDFEARGFLRRTRGSIEIVDLEQFKRFAAEE